jgi:hypothetical protein
MPKTVMVVVVVRVSVPPSAIGCEFPDAHAGVLPSVVYQMVVLASRFVPLLWKVTTCPLEYVPHDGGLVQGVVEGDTD